MVLNILTIGSLVDIWPIALASNLKGGNVHGSFLFLNWFETFKSLFKIRETSGVTDRSCILTNISLQIQDISGKVRISFLTNPEARTNLVHLPWPISNAPRRGGAWRRFEPPQFNRGGSSRFQKSSFSPSPPSELFVRLSRPRRVRHFPRR